ncbi:MAG TPA: hypothetical protein VGH22_05985 [Candidatus Binatia bacterium]|jgi:ketosteroid isomerase-like protein
MSENLNEESRIRAVIESWSRAMCAKDAAGVVSHYAPDAVKFILAPPLQYTSTNPFDKKSLEQWFSSFQGPRIAISVLWRAKMLHSVTA